MDKTQVQLTLKQCLARKLDEQYFEDLRKRGLYWDGERFVREPTMNKRYLDVIRSKPLP